MSWGHHDRSPGVAARPRFSFTPRSTSRGVTSRVRQGTSRRSPRPGRGQSHCSRPTRRLRDFSSAPFDRSQAAAAVAHLQPGDRLGSFEVLGLIGSGGMGEVYRARDTRLERDVAIKVLSSTCGDDRDSREQLEREARAIARLTHPRISTLHDVGTPALAVWRRPIWSWSWSRARPLPRGCDAVRCPLTRR